MTLDEWDEVIDVNLKGIFLTNRAVLPRMIEQREGTIINVSSTSGLTGRAHDGAYCASKFGVNGLTKSIADEVRSYGIKVLAIMPDAIDTPMWEQNHPVPPPGNALPPDHVADLIVFLLTQPRDTVLLDPVIVPLGARRRKPASLTAEMAEPTGSRPKS
jgi:3-oxoacyl-[acyl-carrier protein] reductase